MHHGLLGPVQFFVVERQQRHGDGVSVQGLPVNFATGQNADSAFLLFGIALAEHNIICFAQFVTGANQSGNRFGQWERGGSGK